MSNIRGSLEVFSDLGLQRFVDVLHKDITLLEIFRGSPILFIAHDAVICHRLCLAVFVLPCLLVPFSTGLPAGL